MPFTFLIFHSDKNYDYIKFMKNPNQIHYKTNHFHIKVDSSYFCSILPRQGMIIPLGFLGFEPLPNVLGDVKRKCWKKRAVRCRKRLITVTCLKMNVLHDLWTQHCLKLITGHHLTRDPHLMSQKRNQERK